MLRAIETITLLVTSGTTACRIACEEPHVKNADLCRCDCPTACESYQVQATDCSCEDLPCKPCTPGVGGTATILAFKQTA